MAAPQGCQPRPFRVTWCRPPKRPATSVLSTVLPKCGLEGTPLFNQCESRVVRAFKAQEEDRSHCRSRAVVTSLRWRGPSSDRTCRGGRREVDSRKPRRTDYRTNQSLRLLSASAQGLGDQLTSSGGKSEPGGVEMRDRANTWWLATGQCLLLLMLGLPAPAAHAAASCGNPIASENQLPGTPQRR